MNECIDRDIQEMLPDLLHHTLHSDDRERIEFHLATCESCREELAVLRTVKGAAVFAPAIDVGHVVRQIPPYQPIVPPAQAPARARIAQWLVAATVALLLVGGGSVVMNRQTSTLPAVTSNPATSRSFALAADVASLSDGDLVQLMKEMDNFDALPATEAEPVIAVDSVDSL